MTTAPATRDRELVIGAIRRVDRAAAMRAMAKRLRAEIPSARRLDTGQLEATLEQLMSVNTRAFVRCVREGRSPDERELAPIRWAARQQAAEGMPLEDFTHALRIGERILWHELSQAASPAEREALPAAAGLLMGYMDALAVEATRTYPGRPTGSTDDERDLRRLLDVLCSEDAAAADERQLAERIGLGIDDGYVPFAAAAPGATPDQHAQLAARLRTGRGLAVSEGERVVGLLPRGALPPTTDNGAVVAVGELTARVRLPEALAELRLLIDVGALPAGRPVRVGDFLPELLLARSPRLSAAVRERVLGPLEDYARRRRNDLLETLATFVELDLDRRRAAAALHVHRNTLDYRLRRVEELTGLDLSRSRDLVLVGLALRQRELESGRAARRGAA